MAFTQSRCQVRGSAATEMRGGGGWGKEKKYRWMNARKGVGSTVGREHTDGVSLMEQHTPGRDNSW